MKLKSTSQGHSLENMSSEQLSALKNALLPTVQGYLFIKDMTFAERKEVYRQQKGETKGNSELKKEFALQLEFGKTCAEILQVVAPEVMPVNEAKVVSL